MALRGANRRRSSRFTAVVSAAACILAVGGLAFRCAAVLGSSFVGSSQAHLRRSHRQNSEVRLNAEAAAAAPLKKWSLFMTPVDHYIWRDESNFVATVADAGEWELDVDLIKKVFAEREKPESVQTGIEVFGNAPLYVVKDYVTELKNYGLQAEARETVSTGEVAEDAWRQKDFNSLSPEQKDASEGGNSAADEVGAASNENVDVMIVRDDHRLFDGSEASQMKFRAYVEIAADAAKRFTPAEELLNMMHKKLSRASQGSKVSIMENFAPDAGDAFADKLRAAGFEVEVDKVVQSAK